MMICGVLIFRETRRARAAAQGHRRALPACSGASASARSKRPAMSFWETDAAVRHRSPRRARRRCPGAPARRSCRRSCRGSTRRRSIPSRPMWQFHLVDNYEGGSALIARIHHCYADGIALVRVMLSMTDAAADGPPAMPFEPRRAQASPTPTIALAQLLAAAVRRAGDRAQDRRRRWSRRAPRSGRTPRRRSRSPARGRRSPPRSRSWR